MGSIRSYTSTTEQTAGIWHEARQQFKATLYAHRRMAEDISVLVDELRESERLVEEVGGFPLVDRDVLEIGVGQLPRQLAYFALKNRAIGLDLDVVPNGWHISGYLALLKTNGPKRLLKTVARKALGFDRHFRRALAAHLHVDRLPDPSVRQMDAEHMTFPDASFDLVYSFNVFEHLPKPAAVLHEINRILRPGGCGLVHLHLYTSDSGGHDVTILSRQRAGMPYWPHLRPQQQHRVRNAAYINRLRLADWARIYHECLNAPRLICWPDRDLDLRRKELQEIRAGGELIEYTDEELLTLNLVVLWRKPGDHPAPTGAFA